MHKWYLQAFKYLKGGESTGCRPWLPSGRLCHLPRVSRSSGGNPEDEGMMGMSYFFHTSLSQPYGQILPWICVDLHRIIVLFSPFPLPRELGNLCIFLLAATEVADKPVFRHLRMSNFHCSHPWLILLLKNLCSFICLVCFNGSIWKWWRTGLANVWPVSWNTQDGFLMVTIIICIFNWNCVKVR